MPIIQHNMEALAAFAEKARNYCQFIESLEDGRLDDTYTQLERILAELNLYILPVLMDHADDKHPEFKKVEITSDQRTKISQLAGSVVETHSAVLMQHHKEVNEGIDNNDFDGSIHRSFMLWDDLADMYCDLKYGLNLWELGFDDAKAEAAYQWRWGYENHWGDHLLRAAQTIHEIKYILYES